MLAVVGVICACITEVTIAIIISVIAVVLGVVHTVAVVNCRCVVAVFFFCARDVEEFTVKLYNMGGGCQMCVTSFMNGF